MSRGNMSGREYVKGDVRIPPSMPIYNLAISDARTRPFSVYLKTSLLPVIQSCTHSIQLSKYF